MRIEVALLADLAPCGIDSQRKDRKAKAHDPHPEVFRCETGEIDAMNLNRRQVGDGGAVHAPPCARSGDDCTSRPDQRQTTTDTDSRGCRTEVCLAVNLKELLGMQQAKSRRRVVVAVVAMFGGATLAACGQHGDKPLQGYVEGEYVRVAAPFAGTLQQLTVQRGGSVSAGAPLFALERENEIAARRQAEQQLAAATA